MLEQKRDSQRDVRYDRICRAVVRLNDLLMRSVVAETTTLSRPTGSRQLLTLPTLLEAVITKFTRQALNCNRDCMVLLRQDPQSISRIEHRLRLCWDGHHKPDTLLIDADVTWLGAAFYHVFDHAVKHSVDRKDIFVEIDTVELAENSTKVVVSITNVGEGKLAKADLSKFFDKCYRKEEKGNEPDAGIGLCIARQSIEAHSGTLTVCLMKPGQVQFRIE